MTNCIQEILSFPGCRGRRIEASVKGGDITSDGGVLLLRQEDRVLKLSESVAQALDDLRRRASCQHDALSLVRQRLYALASASTLCRLEHRADRAQAWRLHEVLVE